MKAITFILTFFLFTQVSDNYLMESAVQSFIINFQHSSIDIQFHTSKKSNFDLNRLRKSFNINPSTVTSQRNPMKSQRNQLVVMVIDDLLDYYSDEMGAEPLSVNDFYLIIVTNPIDIDGKVVQKFLNHVWQHNKIININLMAQNNNNNIHNINLITFLPHTEGGCNKASDIKIINKFAENTWESKVFFPMKLKNLHRCPLKLGTQPSSPAAERIIKNNDDHMVEYVGSDIEIANELARLFNFTNEFVFDEWWGMIFENGSGTYNLGKLNEKKIDYVCGWHFLNMVKAKYLDFTQPYYFVPFVVVIPSGKYDFCETFSKV